MLLGVWEALSCDHGVEASRVGSAVVSDKRGHSLRNVNAGCLAPAVQIKLYRDKISVWVGTARRREANRLSTRGESFKTMS